MTLELFVSGPLTNPMNGSHGHWSKHARWARTWRERTALQLLLAKLAGTLPRPATPHRPKAITFELVTWNPVDDDALPPMAKPVRDALMDGFVIHSDAPDSGHVFTYTQRIDRAHRGVHITITLRSAPSPAPGDHAHASA